MQNRAGMTKTTSVSVSKEFKRILEAYDLSPTEVFRKGLAVTLCELGVMPYDNELNRSRLEKSNVFLKEWKEIDEIKKEIEKIKRKFLEK